MFVLSLSSKAPNVNNGGGTRAPPDETAEQWRDGGEWERQKDAETKEVDVADGITPTAETGVLHKGSADKQRFNTAGYQVSLLCVLCMDQIHKDGNLQV